MRSSIPTDGRFKKEDLSLLVGQGFDVDSRSRILAHLGAGCPVCGKALRELTRQPVQQMAPTDDIVALTLRDWVEYQRLPDTMLLNLRPVYAHWIGREEIEINQVEGHPT